MAEPSNIRVNPFTGTGGATNYVELTEKHIIPAVSPYVIRLNEVPEKQDPSNMKMVYVDSATGAATENALTEVAATPSQGEFRPDYSTNAMEDKTWNTGLIEFSASDAGKIVQVTYTGTGTLAAVNTNHWPSWYTDRGDGSDGDFVPTEDTTISGVKNYKSVFIKSGITVTVDKYALVKCIGMFINEGIITVNSVKNLKGDGYASNGGAGGKGVTNDINQSGLPGAAPPVKLNIPINSSPFFGSLGGNGAQGGWEGGYPTEGGGGGGCIHVIAASIKNKIINAQGGNGADGYGYGSTHPGGGGGGGGGCISLIADTILNEGTLNVNGGSGGKDSGGNSMAGASGEAGIKFVKTLGAL